MHQHSLNCIREIGDKVYCTVTKDAIKNPRTSYPAKPLLFPQAKKFSDIFEDYAYVPMVGSSIPKFSERKAWTSEIRSSSGVMKIGPWTKIDTDEHLFVKPKANVLKRIKDSLIVIDDDETYYSIINHANGKSLICIYYNRILGDRWIALISTKSIPKP